MVVAGAAIPSERAPSPRLLFLVTEDWYFWGHRLALARAARDAGYEVVVATRVDAFGDRIRGEGFSLVSLSWERRGFNPLRLGAETLAIIRLYRQLQPDIVHHVSLKPILLGTGAALFARRIVVLNALTGRGYAYTSRSLRARVIAGAVSWVLRLLLRRPNTTVLLENEDDRRFLHETAGIPLAQTAVNPGSGVDMRHFAVLPMPAHEPVTIGCAARMLGIKGIADVVAASRLVRVRNVAHRLILAGGIDAESPDAIPEPTVRQWAQEEDITWLGQIADVRELWRQCHVAVLASLGGEGVPLSLVEAAACGRPLVATDVAGSRDIARDGINALLVPPGSPERLADALERVIADAELRRSFAAESRRIAETTFSHEQVLTATLALYDRLLQQASAGRGHPLPR
jgi:glycosyltransferase involved in cell wall biosynthesis